MFVFLENLDSFDVLLGVAEAVFVCSGVSAHFFVAAAISSDKTPTNQNTKESLKFFPEVYTYIFYRSADPLIFPFSFSQHFSLKTLLG